MNFIRSMLGDGEGSVSSSRVFMFLILLAVLIPNVAHAIRTGSPISFNEQELWALGLVVGGGILKTGAENLGSGNTSTTTRTEKIETAKP